MSTMIVVGREAFLRRRMENFQNAKAAHARAGSPPNILIIGPPEDEVFCDVCNAEITTITIHLVNNGGTAVCYPCKQRWYK